MKKILTTVFVSLMVLSAMAQRHKLWYDQPAGTWLRALPIGNSQLGAMVYGGTDVEELALNEETFWSGSPHDNNSPEAREHLQEVRDLTLMGREEEAHQLLDRYFFHGPHGMRFLPLGSVKLSLGHKNVTDYRRELDLGDALATTTYTYNGVKYERTVFASQNDHAIVVRLTASKKGALSFDVNFDSQLKTNVFGVTEREGVSVNELAAVVDGVEQEGIKAGLKAECRVSVEADGEILRNFQSLGVKDATTATLYIVAATNFVNYYDITLMNPMVLVGIFVGAMMAFLFCGLTMNAVGRAASKMVVEVRRQFREIAGILEGKQRPDYTSCVRISTKAAQHEMILPSLLAIIVPMLVGVILGPAGVIGLLAGGLGAGFVLAIFLANSGGAWDNAKKYVEEGHHGGKNSPAHKATIVGDTVGDPFKDTSGPSLNILIKLMSMVSIVMAGLTVMLH